MQHYGACEPQVQQQTAWEQQAFWKQQAVWEQQAAWEEVSDEHSPNRSRPIVSGLVCPRAAQYMSLAEEAEPHKVQGQKIVAACLQRKQYLTAYLQQRACIESAQAGQKLIEL